jgi:hypothetical protein
MGREQWHRGGEFGWRRVVCCLSALRGVESAQSLIASRTRRPCPEKSGRGGGVQTECIRLKSVHGECHIVHLYVAAGDDNCALGSRRLNC